MGPLYTTKDINPLKNVQKLTMKVCCKRWDFSYKEMLYPLFVIDMNSYLKSNKKKQIIHSIRHFILIPLNPICMAKISKGVGSLKVPSISQTRVARTYILDWNECIENRPTLSADVCRCMHLANYNSYTKQKFIDRGNLLLFMMINYRPICSLEAVGPMASKTCLY